MLKITLKNSVIGYNKRQRATVKALGLGKIGSSVVQSENDCVKGMIKKVGHLLDVETLSDPVEVKV
ncbi:MAG: 50S ribosomal protein L30 [Armatimonadota bacterium]|nr:50S ribosomal protein L30 [bacterium]